MVWSPSFQSRVLADGRYEYRVGHELVDEFLEFASGRARPATVRAYAHDLSVFFGVVGKEPAEVTPKDVLRFVTAQRRPRKGAENVVRISDGGSGLSTSTIKRRLAAVSSLYGYLVIRGDAGVITNPVPRGLPTRRNRHRGEAGAPLVRGVRRLPRILNPDEVEALMAALRTDRDRAMAQAMLLGGLRRGEVLGLRLEDLRLGEWRVFIAEGKGGHQRLVPISPTFFATVADYMNKERPPDAPTDRLFVSLKGPRRGQPLSAEGIIEIFSAARERAGLAHGTCHELRHTCFTRLREGGHGHRGRPGPGRSPLDRVDEDLPAPQHRLAGRGVPQGHGSPPRTRGGGPMSALPKAAEVPSPWWSTMEFPWAETARRAPVMVATMASYLDQLGVSARPTTVAAIEQMLRHFAGQVTEADPTCTSMATVERRHIEAHKLWLAARPGKAGKPLAAVTIRQSARNVAHVLRAATRLGLRRRAKSDVDLPRRLPPSRRAAAEVPRRPDDGQVQGRSGQ